MDARTTGAQGERVPGRWQGFLLAGYLAAIIVKWALAATKFIADDSYFYLVIARNIALHGEQTFSGLFPTNGVHPLWTYLLAAYSWAVHAVMGDQALSNPAYAVPLSAALTIAGACNFWKASARLGIPPLLFVGVPLVFVTTFGVLYSEAHAHYFALSLLVLLSAGGTLTTGRGALLVGAVYALLFLARLDTIFIIATHALWLVTRTRSVRHTLTAGLTAALLVAPYLAWNVVHFGGLTPISGWMKSTLPAISHGDWITVQGLTTHVRGYMVWAGLVPIVFALPVLAVVRGPALARAVGWVLWAGCFGHFLYTAMFTDHHTSWYWYYVGHMVLLALAMGMVLSSDRAWTLATALAALGLAGGLAMSLVRHRGPGLNQIHELQVGLCAEQHITGETMMLSDWPGYLAYATDNPVVAADMLTANRRFYDEMVRAPHPLRFVLDHCRDLGKPVRYVIFTGDGWLKPHADRRAVDFIDPKAGAARRVLGTLRFANPPIFVKEGMTTGPYIVWRLDPDDQAE